MIQGRSYIVQLDARSETEAEVELALFMRDPEGYRTRGETQELKRESAVYMNAEPVGRYLDTMKRALGLKLAHVVAQFPHFLVDGAQKFRLGVSVHRGAVRAGGNALRRRRVRRWRQGGHSRMPKLPARVPGVRGVPPRPLWARLLLVRGRRGLFAVRVVPARKVGGRLVARVQAGRG